MPKKIDEDKVFKAVIQLLITKGYGQTTTSEMAAAANMHEATLFRKYGSKIGLIERAVEHQLATTPMSAVQFSGDLRADLLAILEAYMATVAIHGEIMPMILVEIPRHPELRRTLQTPLKNIEVITDILMRYQDEGLLKRGSTLAAANVLLGPLMVNEMYRRASDITQLPTIDLQEYLDSFLNGQTL